MSTVRNSYETKYIRPVETDSHEEYSEDDMLDDDFVIMVNETEKRKLQKSTNNKRSTFVTDEMKIINARAVAAGITTGAVGLVIGGPVAAAIIGFGTTYVAKNDLQTPVGETVRSVGELLMDATDKVKEIDVKHNISNNTVDKVKEIDSKFKFSERSTELASKTRDLVVTINEKHHLTHTVSDTVSGMAASFGALACTTNNRVRFLNEKHGWTDKLVGVWRDFEKNVLLTDDDIEFEKQIQYLYMEQKLEQEDLEVAHINQVTEGYIVLNNCNSLDLNINQHYTFVY